MGIISMAKSTDIIQAIMNIHKKRESVIVLITVCCAER